MTTAPESSAGGHVPTTDQAESTGREERTGLIRLSQEECADLLASASVGRIVFVDDGQPLALPVNFAWHEGAIVFRTGEGQKLHAATVGQIVSFEIDSIDETHHQGFSVIVKGTAREVTDWAEQEQLEQLPVRPWQRQPWRRGWVCIDPSSITGRRLDLA